MLRNQLPPLNALKAFDAVVRHGSISAAARILCISQSAISRHVINLESFLGCRLLSRSRSGVTLTKAGTAYHERTSRALAEVLKATIELRAEKSGVRVLRVVSLSSFALRWLVPRIHLFQSAHPGIALDVSISDERPDFSKTFDDCAIVSEDIDSGPLNEDVLFSEELLVVCKPELLGGGTINSPQEIGKFPVIHTSTRFELWQKWCVCNGVEEFSAQSVGPTFQDFYITIAAAVAGIGMALVPSFLVRGELSTGKLVEPLSAPYISGRKYRLALALRNKNDSAVMAFRDWLVVESKAGVCIPD